MKKILLTTTLLSITASTGLLCSEKPTRKIEADPFKEVVNGVLLNIAYFGTAGVLSGASTANALTKVKTDISNVYGRPTNPNQHSLMVQLTKKIKICRGLIGISSLAVFSSICSYHNSCYS